MKNDWPTASASTKPCLLSHSNTPISLVLTEPSPTATISNGTGMPADTVRRFRRCTTTLGCWRTSATCPGKITAYVDWQSALPLPDARVASHRDGNRTRIAASAEPANRPHTTTPVNRKPNHTEPQYSVMNITLYRESWQTALNHRAWRQIAVDDSSQGNGCRGSPILSRCTAAWGFAPDAAWTSSVRPTDATYPYRTPTARATHRFSGFPNCSNSTPCTVPRWIFIASTAAFLVRWYRDSPLQPCTAGPPTPTARQKSGRPAPIAGWWVSVCARE